VAVAGRGGGEAERREEWRERRRDERRGEERRGEERDRERGGEEEKRDKRDKRRGAARQLSLSPSPYSLGNINQQTIEYT
jgi:hypothetical protein